MSRFLDYSFSAIPAELYRRVSALSSAASVGSAFACPSRLHVTCRIAFDAIGRESIDAGQDVHPTLVHGLDFAHARIDVDKRTFRMAHIYLNIK